MGRRQAKEGPSSEMRYGGEGQGACGLESGKLKERTLAMLDNGFGDLLRSKVVFGSPSFTVDTGLTQMGGTAISFFLLLTPFVGNISFR